MLSLEKSWNRRLELRRKAHEWWKKADKAMNAANQEKQKRANSVLLFRLKSLQNLYRSKGDVLWAKSDTQWAKTILQREGPSAIVASSFRDGDYDFTVNGKTFQHSVVTA